MLYIIKPKHFTSNETAAVEHRVKGNLHSPNLISVSYIKV